MNIAPLPLEMKWNPKPDITSFELAICLPYLIGHTPIFPGEVDLTEPHFRHFEIANHKK